MWHWRCSRYNNTTDLTISKVCADDQTTEAMEEPPATTEQTTAAVTSTDEVKQTTTDHPAKTEGGDPVTTELQTTTAMTSTDEVEQPTTDLPATTDEVDHTFTDHLTTTEGVHPVTTDRPTTAVTTTDSVEKPTTDHPTTTEGVHPVTTDRQTTAATTTDEVEQTTTDHPTTTEGEHPVMTNRQTTAVTETYEVDQTTTEHPTKTEGGYPVTTELQTTTAMTTTDEVEKTTTKDDPTTTSKFEQTTVDYPTTSEKGKQTTKNNRTSNTIADVSNTIEDLVATTSERREPESILTTMETSTVLQNPPVQSNVPGITIKSIAELKVDIPEGCFERISDLCQSNAVNVTSCSNSTVSDLLVDQILNSISIDLGIQHFIVKNDDFSTSVTHNSICEDNQETDWVETYEIKSSESREPNTTFDVTSVLLTQTFTAVSFLQVKINSFGTSSVQYACQFMNGDALEFSSIVGGIVAGHTIAKSQYDCKKFITVPDSLITGNSSSPGNSKSSPTTKNEYYDLLDAVGLPLEYTIVCIYIVLAYLAAFKAYRLHMQQRTRTDFKTNINISFVILFLVWASGNLLYLILFSTALTETNFFYIKSVLTLTYFATYSGFTLLVQYRYHFVSLLST
jgi:hypothetical protein